MAGTYQNSDKIESSVQKWIENIARPGGTWEGNNIHIDEIESLRETKREEWISVSFNVLNALATKLMQMNSLLLFLHIDLDYSLNKVNPDSLSLEWLRENINEFTPPSFNCTSVEYYKEFYKRELMKCYPDSNILKLISPLLSLSFFYRTYFDSDEGMYSREIYVFVKNKAFPKDKE